MRTASFLLPFVAAALVGATSTASAQAPEIKSVVYATFEPRGAMTELIGLAVGNIPGGTKVTLSCSGPSCPFGSKVINLDKPVSTLAITDMFLDPIFKPGTTIEVRVTKAGLIGKVFQYETQASSEPRMVAQCLPPGSSKAVAC
jgi:hypothetical protein